MCIDNQHQSIAACLNYQLLVLEHQHCHCMMHIVFSRCFTGVFDFQLHLPINFNSSFWTILCSMERWCCALNIACMLLCMVKVLPWQANERVIVGTNSFRVVITRICIRPCLRSQACKHQWGCRPNLCFPDLHSDVVTTWHHKAWKTTVYTKQFNGFVIYREVKYQLMAKAWQIKVCEWGLLVVGYVVISFEMCLNNDDVC